MIPESDLKTAAPKLLRQIRGATVVLMVGLILSGVTAIPLEWQLNTAASWLREHHGATGSLPTGFLSWIMKVQEGVTTTNRQFPFMAYGTDWLAFGHFVIALVFVGLYQDPIRNQWLTRFGIWACLLVIPHAAIFGAVRGIPWGWRVVDCSFGIFGLVPLYYIQTKIRMLERSMPPQES